MKIIQIMPEFGLAGAETMCENLIYELKACGEEVIVVSLYDYHSAITERLEANNVQIVYLNKRKGLDISMIFKLFKLFKKEKPDVIHTHRYVMEYAIPAAIAARVKGRIHTVHNIAKKENGKIARILNKLFYKFANVVPVALSSEIQKTISEEYNLKNEKIPVIFNGINLEKCIPKINYNKNNKLKILHIGRFSEQKNHIGLINAYEKFFEHYKESELNLIGMGETKKEIENKVNEKNIKNNVNFLGTQENVYKFLNDADIFILPSLYEGIPMTLLEAMGTGVPIIASNVGGIPDMLINDKEALLISSQPEEICEALCKLAEDPELRKKLGLNARHKSRYFSAENMAQKYLEVYKKQKIGV